MRKNTFLLACDRSLRTVDKDGRLHVELSNISKAQVSPYAGREVPKYKELGLDPDKTYLFYRDPAELAKAVKTFNNLPILNRHVPVSAENHQPNLVIGSTGTDAVFEAPYLKNSLVIWAKDAIEDVLSGDQAELSCGYYWTPKMEPGSIDGERFDGRMTNIVGNHLATVEAGRAGPDVIVADSREGLSMRIKISRKAALVQGALLAHLAPILALDSKVELTPFLWKVTNDNYKASRAAILAGVRRACAGKIAADAELDDDAVQRLLEALEGINPAEDDEAAPDPEKAVEKVGKVVEGPIKTAADVDPLAAIKEFLAGKISPEDLAMIDELFAAPAQDQESIAEENARKDKIRSDAQHERDGMLNAAKTEGEPSKIAGKLAADSRQLAAAAGFASRYGAPRISETTFGVRPRTAARVNGAGEQLAKDEKPAAAKGFHERYPDAGRITQL